MEKKEKNKRLHEGRPDAEKVINELMEGVDLKQSVQEEAESKIWNSILVILSHLHSRNLFVHSSIWTSIVRRS